MIADRLLAWLRSTLGFAPTGWSLVRVALFAGLGLVLVAHFLPHRPGELVSPWNKSKGAERSRVVSLQLGDTRGYRPSHRPRAFRIAWVGGSEILGVNPKRKSVIPGLVSNRIRSVDGRPTTTDIYFQNAMRLGDELSSLRRALEAEPDMVVVSLNPVWVLNDLAVQQWSYLDGLLARGSMWPPSSWPVGVSFVSPGDLGWKGLSRALTPVDDRLHWGSQLTRSTAGLSFLQKVEGGTEPAATELGRLALRRPVDFWHEHHSGLRPGATVAEQQLSILRRGVDSQSGLNRAVLREMLAAVRRAGVDAYFYVPAVAPEVYADPEGARYIERLRAQLAEAARGQTTARVRFDPQGLQSRVRPARYQDIVHKIDPGPEVDVITGDLCGLLEDRDHQTGCETP